MTRQSTWGTSAAFLVAVAAIPAGAQQPPNKPAGEDPPQAARETTMPDQRAQPILVRTDTIIGAGVVNKKGEKLGKIVDLVVDARTGRFTDAVVATDKSLGISERNALIRWTTMTWDADHERFSTETGKEQIEQAPPFKPEQYDSQPQAIRDAGTERPEGKKDAKDGTDRSQHDGKEVPDKTLAAGRVAEAATTTPTGHRLVSKIADFRVVAGNDDLGSCVGLWAEVRTGCLAFASATLGDVLGVGGTTYLVPWSALVIRTEGTKKPQIQIATMTRKQFEAAPRLEGKNDLANPTFRGRIYQFFGTELPEYEPDRDLMGKIGKSNEDAQPSKR